MANLQLYISHFSESGIWLGKILANDASFAKFTSFPLHNLLYMVFEEPAQLNIQRCEKIAISLFAFSVALSRCPSSLQCEDSVLKLTEYILAIYGIFSSQKFLAARRS